MEHSFSYHTERLLLKVLDETGARAVLSYYLRNRPFHQPFFAARDDSVFTLTHQKRILAADYRDFAAGRALHLYIFLKDNEQHMIGRIAFSNIVRGCFQSCFMGYHLDEQAQGFGYACEAVRAALKIMFEDFGLHRIEANIMPRNSRSISLVQRLGFELEGLSPRYLEINGNWEDHLHYALLSDRPLVDSSDYPLLKSDRLIIRLLEEPDIPSIIQYYDRNFQHLNQFNPVDIDSQASPAYWERQIAIGIQNFRAGRRFDFGLYLQNTPSCLIGMIHFSDVEPLPFSCCEIGYSIDHQMVGQGMMYEALVVALQYAFEEFGINRIFARIHIENELSIRLLQFLEFKVEGRVRQGLYLHGAHQDLLQLSILRDDYNRDQSINRAGC